MPSKMKVDDEIRVRILDALFHKGSLTPNLKQIQKITGYNKNTIKASLDFLWKEGSIFGLEPKLNMSKFGLNLMPLSVSFRDMSYKDLHEEVVKRVNRDPHIFFFGEVIGPGKWNVLTMHLYKDLDDYHHKVKDTYDVLPEYYDYIKDRQKFYRTGTAWKYESRSRAAVDVMKADLGIK